nr:tetra-peptide repeat homeobox protein 1-like [Onthophagus taurus]
MKSLLILVICLGVVSCGNLHGLLEPPVSSGGYSTGYATGGFSASAASSGHSEYNTIEYSSNEASHGISQGIDLTNVQEGASFSHGFHGKPGVVQTGTTVNHQTQKVAIPVPQPIKVHVNRPVPVPVAVPRPVEVPRPVPIHVPQPVPVTITRPVPVTIPKPVPVPVQQPVYVRVPQPVQVPVAQPYPVVVPQPYPVRIQTPISVGVPVYQSGGVYGGGIYNGGFSSGGVYNGGISSGGIHSGGVTGASSLIGTGASFSGVTNNYGSGAHLGLGAYQGSLQDCPTPAGFETPISSGLIGKYPTDFSHYGGHSFGVAPLNNNINSGWVGKHQTQIYDNTISQAYDSNGGYKY